jgi:hypothetical protein
MPDTMRHHGPADRGAQGKTGYFFTGHVDFLLSAAFCFFKRAIQLFRTEAAVSPA